jgi:Spy/CpxP family protein refolding chaperone
MKKIMLTAIAFTLAVFSADAQVERKIKQHKQHQRHDAMKQLNLSEDQKKQAGAIKQEYRLKMQDLNKNESITVKESRDRKDALRKEQKNRMQGLLTSEQKNKLEQIKANKKASKEAHYAKRMDKMKTHLQLTDDQVAKLKAGHEASKNRLKSIKENQGLDRVQRKEELMALKNERKTKMESILTTEQKEKMKQMRKKHGGKHQAK